MPTGFWRDFARELATCAAARGFHGETLHGSPAGDLEVWQRPGPGRRVYVSAGIHGDEPAGPLALLEWLREERPDEQVHWVLCPTLNPEGLAEGRREHPSGLDLNRDYYKRSHPGVAAHAAWLAAQPVPDLFLSLHEDWESSGFYFYEINLGADQPARAEAVLAAAAGWFPVEQAACIDGHEVRAPGWIYHANRADVPDGWPEAIYLARLGCPVSFTFETPSQGALARRIGAHRAAMAAALAWRPE